jgi:glycolate oxidase FAD binding subunit
LHPLPQTEQTLSFEFENPAAANQTVLALLDSVLTFTGLQLRCSGGPICMLDVRFEGVANAVEEQASRAERIVGNDVANGKPLGMPNSNVWRTPSQLWDDSPQCICKVSVLPTEIAAVIDHASSLAEASGVRVQAVVQAVGVGLLRLDGSTEALLSIINSLRELIAPRHGSLVLLHAGDELRGQTDIWGEVGTALGVMQSMKRQFDDKAILNPGRFAGGI